MISHNAFMAILKELQSREGEVLDKRAELYSTDYNRTHNFEAIGNRVNMKPPVVALILAYKHLVALEDWLLNYNRQKYDTVDASDFKQVEEWIIDIRNYLAFIYAMLYENIEYDN
ncbi:MAG: hypothetical protein QXV73_04035 [Candidatus Micrarchaeia archaeon]